MSAARESVEAPEETRQREEIPLPDLLSVALGAPRDCPEAAERTRVHIALRARITALLPVVQAQMKTLPGRSRSWYARDTAVHDAQQWMTGGLSPSPMAAGVHLAELGRRLKTLDEFAREEL
ncbi:DUF6415 family natural product biosynthesis protein [Streptomyces sp. cg28]|uniref:DUF6415 family natural product biosynthesis protein n=1 Tax=Streptomyces sp. cg28 TaxID=3403457 RepID=UPI003B221477